MMTILFFGVILIVILAGNYIIKERRRKELMIYEVMLNVDKFETDKFYDGLPYRQFTWKDKYQVMCWHNGKYAIIYEYEKRYKCIMNQFDNPQLSHALYNGLMNY